MGQTDVLVDQEHRVHRAADGQPAGRPDYPAELLPGQAGRAGHGGERAHRIGADGHASHAQMGHEAGPDASSGLRETRIRHGRVLGLRGGHRHQAREPPFGHVQNGPGLGSRLGGRPPAPGDRRAQSAGDGRVRVPHRAQLQSHRAHHHGGREGIRHGEKHMERLRSREQRSVAVHQQITVARRILYIEQCSSCFSLITTEKILYILFFKTVFH